MKNQVVIKYHQKKAPSVSTKKDKTLIWVECCNNEQFSFKMWQHWNMGRKRVKVPGIEVVNGWQLPMPIEDNQSADSQMGCFKFIK